ncbi:MAG: hypothetical protein ACI923_001613 [Flavobacteriales bacterium]|jgi:hypothetical protein
MAKYIDFWQKLLLEFNADLDNSKPLDITFRESDIDKIGKRESYSGYLEVFGVDVRNHSHSQVFRDLAEAIKNNKSLKVKLTGQLEVKIDKFLLISFNYKPFSWELMMNRYRDYQDKTQMVGELYKWELVKKFQNLWGQFERKEISFVDFFLQIDFNNLVYNHAISLWKALLEEKPKKFEQALLAFYDESNDLQDRILTFRDTLVSLHEQLGGNSLKSHGQEERAFATLLAYRYPEKYTFYLDSFYSPLAKCLGQKPENPWYKLVDYYKIVSRFKENVLVNYEDVIAVKNRLTQDSSFYDDNQHLLLIQDIFYVTFMKGPGNSVDLIKNESIEELSEYQYVVSQLNKEDFSFFISFLRNCVLNFQLNPNQTNIAFTLRKGGNQLNFIVNNRIILAIQGKKDKSLFLAIDGVQYGERSEEFRNNKGEVEAYLNFGLDREKINSNQEGILQHSRLELDRNHQARLHEQSNQEFMNEVFKEVQTRTAIPMNKILYGPPGTGKTFRLKRDFFPRYSVKETSLTEEEHFTEVVQDLSWFQVIALALMEEGRAKVQTILNNRWVQVKASLSASKNIRATAWGSLQTHTSRDCEYVKYQNRTEPLIFNKVENSYWEILEDLVEEQAPEILEAKEKVDNFQANPNQEIKRYVFTTFHQAFTYEDFIEGIKPKMDASEAEDLGYEISDGVFKRICKRAANDPKNRYAIFIDEINRGNIANIFGELITLIEADKRKGMENEMSVTLPYSKERFSVPANLDIIGTMNTADRSVEALDTALRRRFNFQEMLPKPNLIEEVLGKNGIYEGLPLMKVLETINLRIEKLVGRDHTIGHAYFLKLKDSHDLRLDLASVFCDNIIPLLQEYFFNDYPKIGLVLGEGFIQRKEAKVVFAKFPLADYQDEYASRDTYQLRSKEELLIDDELEKALKLLLGEHD